VRGVLKRFSEEAFIVRMTRCESRSIAAKRRLSLNAFFGDTYGAEILQAISFAASIHSTITSWISIVPPQGWLSNWTAEDITTVQAKFAIKRGQNSWLAMESSCCDSGIIRFAKSSTACCEQSGLQLRSDRKTIPHLHPLGAPPGRDPEGQANLRSPNASKQVAITLT
jgi:hypothetical protein